jgi:hypothetical protein
MITLIKHPNRRNSLLIALAASAVAHLALIAAVRNASFVSLAVGMSNIEFVEEDYDKMILIDFSKKLKYPAGYIGFVSPSKVRALDEQKKEQQRQERMAAARREKQKKEEEARRKREEAEELARQVAEKQKTEEAARQKDLAMANPSPTPTPAPTPTPDSYGRFGKINTAPIKDQLQRLYDAKKAGKLVLPEGKLRVGVEGTISPDGTIAQYRISIPSGIEEIDEAAKAILNAVSESRALGVLHSLTSLSMVLDIDQNAELRVVGYANTEQDAADIANLAQVALLTARLKKAGDAAAMVMLDNLKVKRDGAKINAIISVPRQMASDTMNKTLGKADAAPKEIHEELRDQSLAGR